MRLHRGEWSGFSTQAQGHQVGEPTPLNKAYILRDDEKNNGLFIDGLVGNYFIDTDYSPVLTPPRSDVIKTREILLSLLNIPVTRLYLGHYGISTNPRAVIKRSPDGIQRIVDIAEQCIKEGKPEQIEPMVLASKMLEPVKWTRQGAPPIIC